MYNLLLTYLGGFKEYIGILGILNILAGAVIILSFILYKLNVLDDSTYYALCRSRIRFMHWLGIVVLCLGSTLTYIYNIL